jgi:hypothetical protein
MDGTREAKAKMDPAQAAPQAARHARLIEQV